MTHLDTITHFRKALQSAAGFAQKLQQSMYKLQQSMQQLKQSGFAHKLL
jgi:hypothetical protein